ncbi:MAG TPA: uracil-DNA glycosylase family protein, partial [Thermodesulfobacteriota bacterium]|nr:uracil-DNA glycosylase family protein [Thermodesulfobacteriota bacterium]
MSVAPDGSLVPRRVVGWHTAPLGGRRVLKISFAASARPAGRRAVAWVTHDHEVLTRRGWVRAEALGPDDEIATGLGLSRVALELAVGTLLGGGSLSRGAARLTTGHARARREYVEWKARALRELSPVVYDGVARRGADGREYATTVCRTRASRALAVLRGRFYEGGRKRVPPDLRLTPRMVAIWFLDSGDARPGAGGRPVAELAADAFGPEGVARLVERLRDDLGLEAAVPEGHAGRIRLGPEAAWRLCALVAPYAPPCLRDRLPRELERRIPFDPGLYEPGPPETLFDRVVVEPVEVAGADRTVYCLDVEETHNFVTAGGVVHNCRPPNNRAPEPDEIAACQPFLRQQLAVVRPRIVVALGSVAAQTLLGTTRGITALRGRFHRAGDCLVMPTFHPAYLLRNPAAKREVWEDMKLVREALRAAGPSQPPAGGAAGRRGG